MNKARREAIAKLISAIDALHSQADDILNEEQEYFDNMPESFQAGEKGDAAQEAIENLEAAVQALNEAQEALENIS